MKQKFIDGTNIFNYVPVCIGRADYCGSTGCGDVYTDHHLCHHWLKIQVWVGCIAGKLDRSLMKMAIAHECLASVLYCSSA